MCVCIVYSDQVLRDKEVVHLQESSYAYGMGHEHLKIKTGPMSTQCSKLRVHPGCIFWLPGA